MSGDEARGLLAQSVGVVEVLTIRLDVVLAPSECDRIKETPTTMDRPVEPLEATISRPVRTTLRFDALSRLPEVVRHVPFAAHRSCVAV